MYLLTMVSSSLSLSCLGPVGRVLYQMLVVQAFRADRLLAMAAGFVATVMGESFMECAEQELQLATIVSKEVQQMRVPLLNFKTTFGQVLISRTNFRGAGIICPSNTGSMSPSLQSKTFLHYVLH